jgi:hypothetical protein
LIRPLNGWSNVFNGEPVCVATRPAEGVRESRPARPRRPSCAPAPADEGLAEPAGRVASAFEDDAEHRAALVRHGFVQLRTRPDFWVRGLAEPPEARPAA